VAGPAHALLFKLGETAHRGVATAEGVLIPRTVGNERVVAPENFSNYYFANS